MKNIENIEQILRELKFINPEINEKDEKLKLIVSRMLEAKPQIENKTFKANLKKEIMKEIALRNKKAFNFFPLKTLGFLLSGAAFSYAVFTMTGPLDYIKPLDNKDNTGGVLSSKIEGTSKQENTGNETDSINKVQEIKQNKESKEIAKLSPKSNISQSLETSQTNTSETKNLEDSQIDSDSVSKTTSSDSIISPENTPSSDMMLKGTRISDDNTSSDENLDRDASFDDSSFIASDDSITTMSLMADMPEKEFSKDEFIESLKGSDENLISVLKSSEIKLENDILTIKAISKSDFDIINIPENLKLIKEKMRDLYGFYGEIKMNY